MSRTSTTGALVWPPVQRAPILTGVAGGVGTTTIATVLGSTDRGVYRPGLSVDVLVCRSTATSLASSLTAVQSAPGRPVLLVVADAPGTPPKTAAARMRMVQAHTTAVIYLPWVAQLRDSDTPAQDLAAAVRAAQPPKWALPARAAFAELLDTLVPLLRAPDPNHRPVPRGPDPVTPAPAHPHRGFTAPTTFHH
ncbi:hypothetical protein RHODO2019_17955 (plasmid) [Rhodococcus antarcticus]|uniref:Uncharacterized protein n=1 Tax=Rhodococcus antarcticus TaxID=2987751 RepID=A0ABY6P5D3_9NOCA|nr:hypothetical protein [Rhodococcus antarcticus]UZJ26880.1 hypothetical protein RHODO2019_17955 [Rhodococcus antarcticus]